MPLTPFAQNSDGIGKTSGYTGIRVRRDTQYTIVTPPALITGSKRPKITGNDARLGLAVYVTYGIAKQARYELETLNAELDKMGHDKATKRQYIKDLERRLIEQYTPVLNEMSMYQVKVLLKLIDRETGNSSYELVREVKGGFSAMLWQGVAKIFGANLKTKFSDSHDDKMIAFYCDLYDEGLLYDFLIKRTTAFDRSSSKKKK